MKLSEYINLERGNATSLANDLQISISYLSQMSSGVAPISPARAVLIEKRTNGVVSRRDLFSNNWQDIWPELADQ